MSAQLAFARSRVKRLCVRSVYVSKNYPKNLQPSSRRVVEGEKKLKANRVLRDDISSGEPCLPGQSLDRSIWARPLDP